jgi:hypothetical protein
MTANRTRAEAALAFIVHEIRDEWDTAGIHAALRKVSDRPLDATTAAALYCAVNRPDQRNPAVIALDGEHWNALDRMAGKTVTPRTPQPPTAAQIECRIHGDSSPCRGCAADAKAIHDEDEQDTTPERAEGETLTEWARRIAAITEGASHE